MEALAEVTPPLRSHEKASVSSCSRWPSFRGMCPCYLLTFFTMGGKFIDSCRYHIGESLIPSARHFLRFIGAEEKVAEHGFAMKASRILASVICLYVEIRQTRSPAM